MEKRKYWILKVEYDDMIRWKPKFSELIRQTENLIIIKYNLKIVLLKTIANDPVILP